MMTIDSSTYATDIDKIEAQKPNYQTLASWWKAWPEAKPELLDFWSRGGYVQRLLWRKNSSRPSITVGVRYIDEIEDVLKRAALLGVEIDVLWTGDISNTSLIMVPQDVDYEGVGGWGYATCIGDKIDDRRGGSEWVPAMAWANRVPDTLTDWISEHALEFLLDGTLFIAPAQSVGSSSGMNKGVSYLYEDFSRSTTVFNGKAAFKLIDELKMPALENMSVRDIHKFCRDYQDELSSFRAAVSAILSGSISDVSDAKAQVEDSVNEINQSMKFSGMRNSLIAAGGALATFNLGLSSEIAAKAVGAGFVAHSALQWWCEKTIANREARNKPYWPIWKLKKGRTQNEFRGSIFSEGTNFPTLPASNKQLSHWLAPPSPGWGIPTARRL